MLCDHNCQTSPELLSFNKTETLNSESDSVSHSGMSDSLSPHGV